MRRGRERDGEERRREGSEGRGGRKGRRRREEDGKEM